MRASTAKCASSVRDASWQCVVGATLCPHTQPLTPCCADVSRAEAHHEGPPQAAGGDRGAGLGTQPCCRWPTLCAFLTPWLSQQANAEQRAQLKQLDEDAEYVQVRQEAHNACRRHDADDGSLSTQHFPKDEKYVSLFVTDGDQVHAAAERLRLRALIKTQRAEEALLTEKDEGAARNRMAAWQAWVHQGMRSADVRACVMLITHRRVHRRGFASRPRGCRRGRPGR